MLYCTILYSNSLTRFVSLVLFHVASQQEAQVYITLFLWGRYRWRTAITVEHFLYDLLMPLRVAVLLLAYFAWPRLAGWYGIALFVFAVLLKRPPFVPARSLVAVLRDAGAAETLADPSQPPQQVVLLYSPAASRSKAFLRSFHALSRRYSSENLRFYAMNVDADPSLAQRYNINLALFTKQVPTVMLFARGRAIDQLPLLLGGGNANSNSSGSGSDNNSSAVAKSAGRVRVLPLTAAGLEKEFALAARCEAVLSDCQEQ